MVMRIFRGDSLKRLWMELVEGQHLLRGDLRKRVVWFIRLRWLAIGTGLVGIWIAYLTGQDVPLVPLNAILFVVVVSNALFEIKKRKQESSGSPQNRPFSVLAHLQVALDILALNSLIYFTGGMDSPLVFFVILPLIMAGLLLPSLSCLAYGVLVVLTLGGILLLQQSGLIPLQSAGALVSMLVQDEGSSRFFLLFLPLSVVLLISVCLMTAVRASLTSEDREPERFARALELNGARLAALYEMVKEMGSCSDLKEMMDLATCQTAGIMGAKACSIKLLDDDTGRLRFGSTYGLSEKYIFKGTIDVERSPINREIIRGTPFVIGHIDEDDFFQYPDDMRKEGIASMLCLPLKVETRIFGVFSVYSGESHRFQGEDVKLFSMMGDLTALAVENLRGGLTRFWFMMKVAHQLRSPLSAILSMLKLVQGGFLGSINEKQGETLERCQKRIEMLGSLINDLLKLGEKRSQAARLTTYPVDLVKVVTPLVHLYRAQASDKGLEISLRIQDNIPRILASEKLIDELITNLISNAVKYTPGGGKIEVIITREGHRQVRLEVSDTGIGIPEEDVPRLFTEFFRTESAKTLVEEGTGLGLVIVKEIVDRLGGKIDVRSKIGHGSRFTCLLPTLPPCQRPPAKPGA